MVSAYRHFPDIPDLLAIHMNLQDTVIAETLATDRSVALNTITDSWHSSTGYKFLDASSFQAMPHALHIGIRPL